MIMGNAFSAKEYAVETMGKESLMICKSFVFKKKIKQKICSLARLVGYV